MPPLATAEFQSTLAKVATLASTDVAAALRVAVDRLTQRELLAFVTDAYPVTLAKFLRAAADLTAQWYGEQPASRTDFIPEPALLLPAKQLAASGRWAMLQPDPISAVSGSTTRAVFNQSRITVVGNAARENVPWARYASPQACGFCRMLATRGAVYKSQQTAMRAHDHCKCLALPIRDGVYEAPAYVQQWEDDYKKAFSKFGSDPKAIAKAMDSRTPDQAERVEKAKAAPVDLDASAAEVAKRQLPLLKKNLTALRSKGLADDSQQITWHKQQIARMERDLANAN